MAWYQSKQQMCDSIYYCEEEWGYLPWLVGLIEAGMLADKT